MSTTLSLDDDTFRLVKRYAASRSLALGKAVSELVRRALTTPCPTRSLNGLRIFALAPESPKVSSRKVRALEAYRKYLHSLSLHSPCQTLRNNVLVFSYLQNYLDNKLPSAVTSPCKIPRPVARASLSRIPLAKFRR